MTAVYLKCIDEFLMRNFVIYSILPVRARRILCKYFISVYIDLLFTFDDESVTNNNEALYIYF